VLRVRVRVRVRVKIKVKVRVRLGSIIAIRASVGEVALFLIQL